ncbi:MAG: AI-2E family transporter [Legionellaceae bacterium]|nr:AI-2E family transporter [Legionellaceae bacterium]
MKAGSKSSEGTQGIFLVVGLIFILGVIKLSANLLVPFLLALSLSIILEPIIKFVTKFGIPSWIAVFGLFIIAALPMIAIASYLAAEINSFIANFGTLKNQFYSWLNNTSEWLNSFGVAYSNQTLEKFIHSSKVPSILQSIVVETGNQLSNILMIFILLIYMLLESNSMAFKLTSVAKFNPALVETISHLFKRIKVYFVIKVQTSILSSICIFIALLVLGIKYAALWAVLAFFLNFIPIIGSIIAAIPPIVLALIEGSLAGVAWVTGFYLVLEMIFGNVIEPRMMSRGLGLSALVILLSMTFWGWLLGPTGMILSVPLTMCLQAFFSNYEQTKWVSLMLSD